MKKFFQLMFVAALLVTSTLEAAQFGEYFEAQGFSYPEDGNSRSAMRRIAIMDAYRYLAEEVDP